MNPNINTLLETVCQKIVHNSSTTIKIREETIDLPFVPLCSFVDELIIWYGLSHKNKYKETEEFKMNSKRTLEMTY